MRNLVVMSMASDCKMSAIELLKEFQKKDKRLNDYMSNLGGTIIYVEKLPYQSGFFNEKKCEYGMNPGIPYGLLSEILSKYGRKQDDCILYPGFTFAQEHNAEFIEPNKDWTRVAGSRDEVFMLDKMESFPVFGLAIVTFASLFDRMNERRGTDQEKIAANDYKKFIAFNLIPYDKETFDTKEISDMTASEVERTRKFISNTYKIDDLVGVKGEVISLDSFINEFSKGIDEDQFNLILERVDINETALKSVYGMATILESNDNGLNPLLKLMLSNKDNEMICFTALCNTETINSMIKDPVDKNNIRTVLGWFTGGALLKSGLVKKSNLENISVVLNTKGVE